MYHGLLYLAGATAFLFGFFLFGDYTDTYPSMVYLQYTCIAAVFYILILAVVAYTRSRPKKMDYKEKREVRRSGYKSRKDSRMARKKWQNY